MISAPAYRIVEAEGSIAMVENGQAIGRLCYEILDTGYGIPRAIITDFGFDGTDSEAEAFRHEISRRLAGKASFVVSRVYNDGGSAVPGREEEYEALSRVMPLDRGLWPSYKIEGFYFRMPLRESVPV